MSKISQKLQILPSPKNRREAERFGDYSSTYIKLKQLEDRLFKALKSARRQLPLSKRFGIMMSAIWDAIRSF